VSSVRRLKGSTPEYRKVGYRENHVPKDWRGWQKEQGDARPKRWKGRNNAVIVRKEKRTAEKKQ